MTGQLLETKFFVPSKRRGVVPRARLRERLDRITDVTVTLVAAPAGFGKTTLLVDWLAGTSAEHAAVAWLSLDQADDDPVSFWRYLVAALQTVLPNVGADALVLLTSPQPSRSNRCSRPCSTSSMWSRKTSWWYSVTTT